MDSGDDTLALPFVLVILVSKIAESLEESDYQENNEDVVPQVVSFPTGKKIVTSVVVIAILLSSILLVSSNYRHYDEYSGGELGCSNQDNMHLGVIPFSSLNEVDKKVFRMIINHSYLVSVRDDLNETREYQLMVTKDSGNDRIIIYEGKERDGDRRAFLPPDGLLNEPKMDITGSEYFSGGLQENQHIQYQGELYRCHIDEFRYPGA